MYLHIHYRGKSYWLTYSHQTPSKISELISRRHVLVHIFKIWLGWWWGKKWCGRVNQKADSLKLPSNSLFLLSLIAPVTIRCLLHSLNKFCDNVCVCVCVCVCVSVSICCNGKVGVVSGQHLYRSATRMALLLLTWFTLGCFNTYKCNSGKKKLRRQKEL